MEKRQNVGTKSAFTPKKKMYQDIKPKQHIYYQMKPIFFSKKKKSGSVFLQKNPKSSKTDARLSKGKISMLVVNWKLIFQVG